MYSSSSSSTTYSNKAAYQFRYFPRHGRWTPAMQAELDEHSRRMAQLMLHVQDLYKSRDQKMRDQQREDNDADCMGSHVSSQMSSGFSSSPQPRFSTIQGRFAPVVQYVPVHPHPPGYPHKQRHYQF